VQQAKKRKFEELGYIHENRCSLCTLTDKEGNNVRDRVDELAANGKTYRQIQRFIAENYGPYISEQAIGNHFRKHSPFATEAKKLGTKRSRKLRVKVKKEMAEASEAIQRIINAGDQMVVNWIEDREGKKLPVTERLYIEALKEEGRRGAKTTLDIELEQMDKALFEDLEGEEVIDGEEDDS